MTRKVAILVWSIVAGIVMAIALSLTVEKVPAAPAISDVWITMLPATEPEVDPESEAEPRVRRPHAKTAPVKHPAQRHREMAKVLMPTARPPETEINPLPLTPIRQPINSSVETILEPDNQPPALRCHAVCKTHTCKPTEWCMPDCRNVCVGDN